MMAQLLATMIITAVDARRRRPLPAELVAELVYWLPMVWFTGLRRHQLIYGHIPLRASPAIIAHHPPLFVRAHDKFARVIEQIRERMAQRIQPHIDLWKARLDQLQREPPTPANLAEAQTLRTWLEEEAKRGEPAVAALGETTAPERLGLRRCKVIMLGESGVGKTSIIYHHKYGPSPDGLVFSLGATISASYTNFYMTVRNNVPVQLQIWDTAGQERFRCMVPMYMRNASAAILVYDITSRATFEQIDRWHAELYARCPTSSMGGKPVLALIGNKTDQHAEREVEESEGVAKALRLNAKFYEISAIDTDVIRAIFESIAEEIVRKSAEVDSAWEADEAMSVGGEERGGEQDALETKRAGSSCCATL